MLQYTVSLSVTQWTVYGTTGHRGEAVTSAAVVVNRCGHGPRMDHFMKALIVKGRLTTGKTVTQTHVQVNDSKQKLIII